jgi:hypothetical protein
MRTIQLRGPFNKGYKKTLSLDESQKDSFVQIGIELGDSIPFDLDTSKNIEPEIAINGIPYKISNNRVLEWDNFSEKELTIMALKNLDEYTLIDIAYA